MRFIENKKLAARIGIITTIITIVGMALLWLVVSTNAASVVKNDITNQMTDAVESRARYHQRLRALHGGIYDRLRPGRRGP